mmetsp:Transcript_540/g.1313  ORF Transcript_540/g.1313 Transcript_540/m.1313 type:complete len:240 (-) Transcript_540:96-815(-)
MSSWNGTRRARTKARPTAASASARSVSPARSFVERAPQATGGGAIQPASTSSASHLSRVAAAAAAGPQNPRSSGGVASTLMRKAGRPPGAAWSGVVASAPVFSAIVMDRPLSWSSLTRAVFSFSRKQASAAPSPRVTIAEQRRQPNRILSRRAWTSPLNAVPGKAANAVASGQLSLLASEAASSSTSVGVSLTGMGSALGVSGDVGTSILLVWCAFGSLAVCCSPRGPRFRSWSRRRIR